MAMRCFVRSVAIGGLLLFHSALAQACSAELRQQCQACAHSPPGAYNCSLPGLDDLTPGMYEGVTANYLSYATDTSSPMFRSRAKEFEACTGGKIVFSEAANIFTDPVVDLGTKTRTGSEVFDAYFMSYSHFPEVSSLGLAEPLNERIRRDNAKLMWEDVFPSVRTMGSFKRNGVSQVEFLMYDGDFFVPVVRLDLLEKHNIPLPNTWDEVVEIAELFHGTDLNEDGEADFGICHFPRFGAGSWDWWWAELVYSTWATFDQTKGTSEGFLFDPETMKPSLSRGFRRAVEIWKRLWNHGSSAESSHFIQGRCAIGYAPPGTWKRLFRGEVGRTDGNGTVIWRPRMKSGEYAEPYRFKPFGSTEIVDKRSGKLVSCTPELCPKAERIPMNGHLNGGDRASVLPPSPLEGQLINRSPFYWSGGLGTLIRKSSTRIRKDLMWDFFVFTNSPVISRGDVAGYNSWLDSWRLSHLVPNDNFIQAGWSQNSADEHVAVMTWALSNEVNGALNLRLPGAERYTHRVLGNSLLEFMSENISMAVLVETVEKGWDEVTTQKGLLDQLETYRGSLGLLPLSEFELCTVHRQPMDEKDPALCRKYDPATNKKFILFLAGSVCILFVISCGMVYLLLYYRNQATEAFWKVSTSELKFSNPPEFLGQGTFGLVVAAEYRGTKVAVKRVIPPKSAEYDSVGHVDKSTRSGKSLKVEPSSFGMRTIGGMLLDEEESTPTTGKTGVYTGQNYEKLKTNFIQEMRVLAKLRHPSITCVLGAVVAKNEEPMLVMEYMENNSLHDLLHNATIPPFEGPMILQMLRDIASGMRFLHAADPPVIHGDLKANNCLVDRLFRVKVADFGLSSKRQIGVSGTPYFMAPELLRGESTNNATTDCFAFGILLYEIYSRRDPYHGEDAKDVLRLVADTNVNKRPPVPQCCPPKVGSLMEECLHTHPHRRPTFEEIDLQLRRSDVQTIGPRKITGRNRDIHVAKSNRFEEYPYFPPRVAEQLKQGQAVQPESKKAATVLFAEVVFEHELDEEEKVNAVKRLYRKLDKLVGKYDIFRVRTVGYSFMAVANLVDKQQDHTKKIADFSIEAIQTANKTTVDSSDKSKGCFNLSVGLHVGPIVGSVVGRKMSRYCVVGEAVKGAATMSSLSKKNRVLCSSMAARLLRKQFPEVKLLKNAADKGGGFWVNEGGPSGNYAATEELKFDLLGETGHLHNSWNWNRKGKGRNPVRGSRSFK